MTSKSGLQSIRSPTSPSMNTEPAGTERRWEWERLSYTTTQCPGIHQQMGDSASYIAGTSSNECVQFGYLLSYQ